MLMRTTTAALYQNSTQEQLTGRNLAHAERTSAERAFVGADLHLGRIARIRPTVKQVAYLAGVCVPYVAAGIEITNDRAAREAVLAGKVPLLEAAKSIAASTETLAEHLTRATPAERLDCARVFGPAWVWDQMVRAAPLKTSARRRHYRRRRPLTENRARRSSCTMKGDN